MKSVFVFFSVCVNIWRLYDARVCPVFRSSRSGSFLRVQLTNSRLEIVARRPVCVTANKRDNQMGIGFNGRVQCQLMLGWENDKFFINENYIPTSSDVSITIDSEGLTISSRGNIKHTHDDCVPELNSRDTLSIALAASWTSCPLEYEICDATPISENSYKHGPSFLRDLFGDDYVLWLASLSLVFFLATVVVFYYVICVCFRRKHQKQHSSSRCQRTKHDDATTVSKTQDHGTTIHDNTTTGLQTSTKKTVKGGIGNQMKRLVTLRL